MRLLLVSEGALDVGMPSEEGGAQHCQRDYLTLGCATMWSWFEDKLLRA